MLPITATETHITVFCDGEQLNISRNHPSIIGIKKAINENDASKVKELINVEQTINQKLQEYTNEVELINGVVYYRGEPQHNDLTRIIIDLHKDGFGITSYLNFLDKLMKNPSYNSRQQAYKFISEHQLPITEDGDILGYKGVTSEYKDCHTMTFDNSIGAKQRMDRSLVDDNPKNDCSSGFHVGSEEYALRFGNRTMIVKVNPADIVSVPDYDVDKLRVCAYEVVGEYKTTLNKTIYHNDGTEYDEYENIVDLEDLMVSDEIQFKYRGELRHIIIVNIDNNIISGNIRSMDVSWANNPSDFRNFNSDYMTNINLLN